MSKKKSPATKKNYPYNASEQELLDQERPVLPKTLIELEAALKQDVFNLLGELASQAKDETNLGLIDGFENPENLYPRLESALKYIILDDVSRENLGGKIYSYEYGKTKVFELAYIVFKSSVINGDKYDQTDILFLANQIHACMIALIAIGKVQQAFEIARLAGAIKCIKNPDAEGAIKDGSLKKTSAQCTQIRILKVLIGFLNNNEIPSKMALRLEYNNSGMKIYDAQFSRLLSKMKICKWLHDSQRHGNPTDGTIHKVKSIFASFPDQKELDAKLATVDHNCANSIMSDLPNLQCDNESELIGFKITTIKEKFGPAYWIMLIQFGMCPVIDQEGLELFEKKLSEMGLALK